MLNIRVREDGSDDAHRHVPPSRLDRFDHELILRLQENGRAPAASLARDLGLDQRTVRRRVERLLEERVIRIAAVTDPRQLGYRSMALVCVAPGPSGGEQLYRDIRDLPEVDYVTVTTGRFAFQAEVMCADDTELRRVLAEKFRSRPEIQSMEVLYYLRLHYQSAWFGGTGTVDPIAGVRPLELDGVDRQLVSLLAANGRLTFESLAAELDVSETLVRKRYNALTRTGAMRVAAIANPLHLGYEATCWVAITCTPSGRATEIAEELTRIDEVSYVAITAGGFEVLTELVCRTHEDLLSLLDSRVRPISGIERLEIWMYLDLDYKPLLPISVVRGGRGPHRFGAADPAR